MQGFEKLQPQDVREYWKDEARDFTPDLADDISLLEEVLELDLEVIEMEKPVGSYKLDILAQEREMENPRKIVVENQLNSSDHDHLGKAIAYASGVDADVIVWIAPQFNDEHIDAVQWLNNNSHEGVDFFAIRLEVYKIGDSAPAVKLHPVERPSEWKDSIKRPREDLTDTQKLQEEFWRQFRDKIREKDTVLRTRKPRPQHWYNQPVGRSGFKMSFVFNSRDNKVMSEFIVKDDAEAYRQLLAQREEIGKEVGQELTWISPEESRAKRERGKVQAENSAVLENKDEWSDYQDWLCEIGEKMHAAFSKRIREL